MKTEYIRDRRLKGQPVPIILDFYIFISLLHTSY